MPHAIQTGSIFVQHTVALQLLAVDTTAYSKRWRSLSLDNSQALERKVRAAGWNLFFMAEKMSTTALIFPADEQKALKRGLKRLLTRAREQHFNCLQVSVLKKKSLLGVSYLCLAANPRHIQEQYKLQSVEQRAEDTAGVLERAA